MCYYSTTMRRDQFRGAKEGEDLTLSTHQGHTVARGNDDGMIVCIRGGSKAHIANLQFHHAYGRDMAKHYPQLKALIGQPVSCRFREAGHGYAADIFVIDGIMLPMMYLVPGVRFYLGEKRASLETKLGVDDPSIVHDHKIDETPTFIDTARRILGICNIER